MAPFLEHFDNNAPYFFWSRTNEIHVLVFQAHPQLACRMDSVISLVKDEYTILHKAIYMFAIILGGHKTFICDKNIHKKETPSFSLVIA